jgi:anti-anti-sigma regulatory factor
MSPPGRPRFEARVSRRNDGVRLALVGALDEHSGLKDLPSKVDSQVVYLDLGGVERINSCGVRDWMVMIRAMSDHARVVLSNCSPAIVAQLNFVSRFAGDATVESILLPYVCPSCEVEKNVAVSAMEFSVPGFEPPSCDCDDCELPMVFDDVPQSYLAFSTSRR